MVKVTINGVAIEVREGSTIMEAAKLAGSPVPSLCFWKGLNEIGACRVCVVEVEGVDRLVTACDEPVHDGMVVYTNSPRVRAARRTNLRLILSQHDCQCAFCTRSGNCSLQKLAMDANLLYIPYPINIRKEIWDRSTPLIRQESKCIKCMRCIQVCDKIQGLNIWDLAGTGSRVTVNVSHNRKILDADCAFCGQCITHCPTAALRERDDTEPVLDILADPSLTTVVQVAPAVRVAWAEAVGLEPGPAATRKMVAALQRLGLRDVIDPHV
ncbi:MAG: (2Fe-2S)-binding protein, partial [Oscillospiraceae bacterium]|nr:(2Fe-2S)-binding protein [Oscillospiraceae bacterium]